MEDGVSFFFLKNNFELYASINSAAKGNYLLRMRQYSLTEAEETCTAKNIVVNKIKNQYPVVEISKQRDATKRNRSYLRE